MRFSWERGTGTPGSALGPALNTKKKQERAGRPRSQATRFRLSGTLVTDKVVILVTAASRRECRKIARHLVESRLAACVNITPTIQSIYRWEGKLAEEKEFLLLIKSTRELVPEIRKAIIKIHSYAVPEIICLAIVDGSPDYLKWVGDSVKPAAQAEIVLLGGEPTT